MGVQPALRWGLIGASDIAATGMIPALRRMGYEIIGLVSGSADHGRAFARRHGIGFSTTEVEQLVDNPDIDAVYISSVNERHLDHARSAAAAGKHVLCEKPLSTSLEDARSITEACRSHRVTLAVNHHLPASGNHRTIKSLVDDGAIGRVLSVEVRHTTLLAERLRGWRLGPDPGAGAVMDLSCHDASVINSLLGARALTATALTVRQGPWEAQTDDASMAAVLYADEVLVQFHDSFTTPFAPSRLEIHGEAGSIRGIGVMTPDPDGQVFLTNETGTEEITVHDRRHPYDITLEAFDDAVRGLGQPYVTGEDAINALAVSLAIASSAEFGHQVQVDHGVGAGR
jgi:1,5-anhydro-D-fructose reductase (1,5-anhydro-D-mannitol-forming)